MNVTAQQPMGDCSERFRRECEARWWLQQGCRTEERVKELMERIAQRRGQAAADELRQEMRIQWRRRAEWLEP